MIVLNSADTTDHTNNAPTFRHAAATPSRSVGSRPSNTALALYISAAVENEATNVVPR